MEDALKIKVDRKGAFNFELYNRLADALDQAQNNAAGQDLLANAKDFGEGRMREGPFVAYLNTVLETPEQREARLAKEAAARAELARQAKIAELLATTKANDSKENGQKALQALEELLKLDSNNAEGNALYARISDYYNPRNVTTPATALWSAKDTTGKPITVPASDRTTILVFLRPDQQQSTQAIDALRAAVKDNKSVQIVGVVSGSEAGQGAAALAKTGSKWNWPVVADAEYVASGQFSIRQWPTTVVITKSGTQAAHIAGVPASFAVDLGTLLDTTPAKAGAGPMRIVLVLDKSGSMAGQKLTAIQSASKAFLESLDRGDVVSLVSFSTEVQVQLDGVQAGTGMKDLSTSIDSLKAAGGAALQDAITAAEGLSRKATPPVEDSVIVLVTDGEPNIGETSTAGLLGLVKPKGAERTPRVFVIGIGAFEKPCYSVCQGIKRLFGRGGGGHLIFFSFTARPFSAPGARNP